MPEKRPNRREAAAAATRAEILAAARRLFASRGYAATSISDIAGESGVAIQTIYSSVGSKAALVLALNDLIDAEADVAGVAAGFRGETDPARLIRLGVRLTRQLNERCGDLIRILLSAEMSEPDVAAAVRDGMTRHQQGAAGLAAGLAALGAVPVGPAQQKAATAIALMTSPASWRQLTEGAGWTFDAAEEWLARSLIQLVLAPPPE